MLRRLAVTTGFKLYCQSQRPRAVAFARSLRRPEESQQHTLQDILGHLARTSYGRQLRLTGKESVAEFHQRVPVVTFDQLRPWVDRQKAGESALCAEPVVVFEKTSGSSGPAKYIPYTTSLKRSFASMFYLWTYDLFRNAIKPRTGRMFFSISPAFQAPEVLQTGVKVGFGDDSEYLPPVARNLLKPFLNMPPRLKSVQDPFTYRRLLSSYLLADEDLETLSIWNPSYWTCLLDFIVEHRTTLRQDLERGYVDVGTQRFTLPATRPWQRDLFSSSELDWRAVWPHLQLISCWQDGAAQLPFQKLAALFDHVLLQGKGLLATEAPMTIPLHSVTGGVPLVGEIFFEFRDSRGQIHRLHEIAAGEEYELIISQKGGLVRYAIGDRVKVVGEIERTKTLRFVGRGNQVVDMVGEKLNEAFVRGELAELFAAQRSFWCLLPQHGHSRSRYLCLTDRMNLSEAQIAEIDNRLQQAVHYRTARGLGQLDPVHVVARSDAEKRYYEFFVSQGMKWGDIKPSVLLTNTNSAAQLIEFIAA